VFTIGIDPHKGSHTAAVLDGTETVIDELRLVGGAAQPASGDTDVPAMSGTGHMPRVSVLGSLSGFT